MYWWNALRPAGMVLVFAALLLAACGTGDDDMPPASDRDSGTGGLQLAPRTAATATPTPTIAEMPAPSATPTGRVTIAAVGDVMLDRDVGVRIANEGPRVAFDAVSDLLTGADLTVANLETSISDIGTPQPKGYTFRADPMTVASLVMGGIDVVSLANNHALDYGPDALLDTIDRVRAAGIEPVGAGADAASAAAPVIVERNGLRIAFLSWVDTPPEGPGYSAETWSAGAASPGVNWASMEAITAGVQAAASEADVVIALIHCGVEWSTVPSDLQRAYAQAAIDAGAKLVLGHHSHVLQPVEEYGDGLIAYSLGNFVFDGFWDLGNVSGVLQLTLTRDGVESWEMVPVDIIDGLPVPRE